MPVQDFEAVSFQMERRSNTLGKTVKSTATIFFKPDGSMVTQYSPPSRILVFNNRDGEIKVYNEEENTVIQSVNYKSGTENTNFYYFLMGETEDMGLRKLGFALKNTKFEDGLLITEWSAPLDLRETFSSVELVHKEEKPIYLAHKNQRGEVVKKVFYYGFEDISQYLFFPSSITEIEYSKKDSVVSKTSFQNFQFDGAVDPSLFNYQIPKNAKVLK